MSPLQQAHTILVNQRITTMNGLEKLCHSDKDRGPEATRSSLQHAQTKCSEHPNMHDPPTFIDIMSAIQPLASEGDSPTPSESTSCKCRAHLQGGPFLFEQPRATQRSLLFFLCLQLRVTTSARKRPSLQSQIGILGGSQPQSERIHGKSWSVLDLTDCIEKRHVFLYLRE